MQTKLKTKEKRPVKKRKSHHHGDLKAALLSEALNYLEDGGSADELSLRDLARRAGVSQAAPYRHFQDKTDLLAAVAAEGYQILANDLVETSRNYENDPVEQYAQAAIAYLKVAMKHSEHFKLMSGSLLPQECFITHPELYTQAQRAFFALVKVIMNGQKKGQIGEGSLLGKAMNSWTMVHGFTSLYLHGRLHWLGVEEDSAQKALRRVCLDFLYGMKNPDHGKENNFSPCNQPTPSAVFDELGLSVEDFEPGSVQIFDSSQPWPFFSEKTREDAAADDGK